MSRTVRVVIMLMIMALAVEAHGHAIITRMADRQNVTLPQLAAVAGAFDLTLIGEAHDNQDHHDLELDVIRSLFASHPQMAIGVEMMQTDQQRRLDDWIEGRVSEYIMRAVFEENWSDWSMYRDIFIFARDNQIPMVALNVPIAIVRKVSKSGFASLTAEEKKGLPEGTSCDLSNPQVAILRKTFGAVADHVRDGRPFSYFCEAQTVRNSGMAINMVRYLEKHPDRKMVVLTGIWHAIKYAIPNQLDRYGGKLSYTVILPETPELTNKNSGTREADYLVDL